MQVSGKVRVASQPILLRDIYTFPIYKVFIMYFSLKLIIYNVLNILKETDHTRKTLKITSLSSLLSMFC